MYGSVVLGPLVAVKEGDIIVAPVLWETGGRGESMVEDSDGQDEADTHTFSLRQSIWALPFC